MKLTRDKKIEQAAKEIAEWMKQCNCKLKISLDQLKLNREKALCEPDTRFEDSLPSEKTGWDRD